MSSLLLATPSERFEQRVSKVTHDRDAVAWSRYWREGLLEDDPRGVVEELVGSNPDVIAIGPGFDIDKALDLAHTIDEQRPDIVVVLVAEPSIDLLEQALRIGAREVISPDAAPPELRAALLRAFETAQRRRASVVAAPEAATRQHRVISMLSPKGGTGKTTISTNLALGLARRVPGEVVIVDLDLQFGDVFSALHLAPKHTFSDIVHAPALDATALKTFLTPHPTGLYALCAPTNPADADMIGPELVQQVLELLSGEFRHVIIDTAAGFDEATLAAVALSTDLICLTSTDVPSVRNTRKSLEALNHIGFTQQHRHFIVNRADAKVGLTLGDIEETIGLKIDVAVPSSRAVPLAVNQGEPIMLSDPRHPAAVAFTDLVARFEPDHVPGPAEKRKRRRAK